MESINKLNFYQVNKISPVEGGVQFSCEDTKVKSFQDTMIDMIGQMNEVTNKPDVLMKDAMQGKADIHDVMAAVAQSELTVQAATTITGKILQTYEKIMQIQI